MVQEYSIAWPIDTNNRFVHLAFALPWHLATSKFSCLSWVSTLASGSSVTWAENAWPKHPKRGHLRRFSSQTQVHQTENNTHQSVTNRLTSSNHSWTPSLMVRSMIISNCSFLFSISYMCNSKKETKMEHQIIVFSIHPSWGSPLLMKGTHSIGHSIQKTPPFTRLIDVPQSEPLLIAARSSRKASKQRTEEHKRETKNPHKCHSSERYGRICAFPNAVDTSGFLHWWWESYLRFFFKLWNRKYAPFFDCFSQSTILIFSLN